MPSIEYVIYCRKSTDESSGMQTQSIPDQIKKCMDYAKNNGLKIAKKLDDFSDFESDIDIKRENSEPELYNRNIYLETRGLFIIKEQGTAKIPGYRPKWKKLIKMIKQGKIKGLLSYSPDRQARNMVEGGELLDCVDQGLVDLKYTNFHFEPTASGKMMLGIWFVFSKQYSDKLSEDITRGNTTKKTQGKSLGKFKYGYFTNAEQYYEPHPEYFPLIRKAYEMKIYENKSDKQIADRLSANGFQRELKSKTKQIEAKRLGDLWRNEFYYGMYISNDSYYDLREINPYFKPIISEQEFLLLQDKLKGTGLRPKTVKDTNKVYYPFERGMLMGLDEIPFTCTLPNPGRFQKKLDKLRIGNPKLTLADLVSPHQIEFRIINKKSKYNGLSLYFDEIEKQIIKMLDKINISDDLYDQYLEFAKTQLDSINNQKRIEYNKIQVRINSIASQRKGYIKDNLGYNRNAEEDSIYQEELSKYDMQLEELHNNALEINVSERNDLLEISVFLDMLRKAGSYYKKASYVQKRKITSILFSNIVVDNKKRLTFKVKPSIAPLFSGLVESTGNILNIDLFSISKIDFRSTVKLLQFYSAVFNKREYIVSQLSSKQRVLYGFEG